MRIPTKLKKIKQEIVKAANKYNYEFDVLTDSDANKNKYYYFHFKTRADIGRKNPAYSSAIGILRKNKIKYVVAMDSENKSLIWVPFDQSIKFIIHSKEEVYEIT